MCEGFPGFAESDGHRLSRPPRHPECGSGFVGVATPTHETHPISLTCPMEAKALSSGPSSSYIGRDTECLHSMLNHRWLTDGVLISHPQAQLVLMTDVSRSGWGSVLLPHKAEASGHWNCSEADLHINILELKTVFLALKAFLPTVHYKVLLPHKAEASGHWNSSEAYLHINILELKAVFLALKAFLPTVHYKPVMLRTDNSTVAAYIKKQGRTRSPHFTVIIWDLLWWCRDNGITLTVSHISGALNVRTDALSRSRQVATTEWSLHPWLF